MVFPFLFSEIANFILLYLFQLQKGQSLSDLVHFLNKQKAQHGLFGIRLGRINFGRYLALDLSSRDQRQKYMGLVGFIALCTYLFLLVIFYTIARKNARQFCIFIIDGKSKSYITSLLILEAVNISLPAFLFSIFLTFLIGSGEIKINYLSSCIFFSLGIVLVIPVVQQFLHSSENNSA